MGILDFLGDMVSSQLEHNSCKYGELSKDAAARGDYQEAERLRRMSGKAREMSDRHRR